MEPLLCHLYCIECKTNNIFKLYLEDLEINPNIQIMNKLNDICCGNCNKDNRFLKLCNIINISKLRQNKDNYLIIA